MNWHQYLEEQLSKDFKLLKELEDKLRYEDEPRRKLKLNNDIEEIKQQIYARQAEINSLAITSSIIETSSELPTKFSLQRITQSLSLAEQKLMPPQTNQSIEVFFSYAHEDEKLRRDLEKHLTLLERQGVITRWHNHKIGAGREWQNEIDQHLNTSQIILLLISANFIASDYCWDVEVKRAMERHKAQEARVIPVILDSVDWKSAPFGKLQPLPKGGKPIKKWGNRNDAFLSVAEGIRIVVKEVTENL